MRSGVEPPDPGGPERLHPGHTDAQLIGEGPADGLAPRPVDGQMGALSAPVGDGKRALGSEQPEQHQGNRHPEDRAGHDARQVAAAGQPGHAERGEQDAAASKRQAAAAARWHQRVGDADRCHREPCHGRGRAQRTGHHAHTRGQGCPRRPCRGGHVDDPPHHQHRAGEGQQVLPPPEDDQGGAGRHPQDAQGPDRAEQAQRPDQRRKARGMGRLKKLPGSVVDLAHVAPAAGRGAQPEERSHHQQQDHHEPETRRPAQVLRKRRPRPGRAAADHPGRQTWGCRGPFAVDGRAIWINPGAAARMTVLARCAHPATLPTVQAIMRHPRPGGQAAAW